MKQQKNKSTVRRDELAGKKRELSDMEFYKVAIRMRKEITFLLLRDFGIKNKIRKASAVTNGMSEEDASVFRSLVEKYDCAYILEEYPSWLVDKMRSSVLDILQQLMMNIRQANTIYPTNESECYDKRNIQNHAIGNCEQLLEEMQYIISVVPTDANKYMRYVDMIEKEIALLKGWRKSGNEKLKEIRGKPSEN